MASTEQNLQRSGSEIDAEKPTVQHTNATDNSNIDHVEHPQRTVEDMEGAGGLKGLLANPFVFATAIFASLGGLLFGCKIKYWHCVQLSSYDH